MKWQKKLRKDQLKHFRYATHGVMTLQAFKENRQNQLRQEPKYGTCLDCWIIARELGIE